MSNSLEDIVRELEQRRDELAPLVVEHDRIQSALLALRAIDGIDGTPLKRPEAPKETRTRARRRQRGKITLEEVRDAALAMRDFNLVELAARIGASGSRGRVGQFVAELVEKGTVERYGGQRGPTTRWRVPEREHSELRSESPGREKEPGWKANGAVPHTGVTGPAPTPGALKRQQERGALIKA